MRHKVLTGQVEQMPLANLTSSSRDLFECASSIAKNASGYCSHSTPSLSRMPLVRLAYARCDDILFPFVL